VGRSSQKYGLLQKFSKKAKEENNRPNGENSNNLVTLLPAKIIGLQKPLFAANEAPALLLIFCPDWRATGARNTICSSRSTTYIYF
jgi:hypothetical protein